MSAIILTRDKICNYHINQAQTTQIHLADAIVAQANNPIFRIPINN